jgi:plasmid stabilization system protein ParE
MPEAWSNKRERQYEHIKDSEKKQGRSTKRAKEIAARTVNKERAQKGETKGSSSSGSRSRSESSRRPSVAVERHLEAAEPEADARP